MFDLLEKAKYVFEDFSYDCPTLSFLIEQSPRKRTVKYGLSPGTCSYHLAFPYVQLIPSFLDYRDDGAADPDDIYCCLRIGMTRTPFKLGDEIYNIPLPNIFASVCMSSDFEGGIDISPITPTPIKMLNILSKKSAETIESFWNSRFNYFDCDQKWINLSKTDPMAAFNFKEISKHFYLQAYDPIDFRPPSEIMNMIKNFLESK